MLSECFTEELMYVFPDKYFWIAGRPKSQLSEKEFYFKNTYKIILKIYHDISNGILFNSLQTRCNFLFLKRMNNSKI